ncbi:MAG TPA: PIN domain-containing protein [Candidatus Solibacter sp.]|nr:PIN domain-containing protein [Candidatus Solibacter sp.]
MILIDTPVWSLALRRKPEHLSSRDIRLKTLWNQIVEDGRAELLGSVRQELLSGLREESQFQRLKSYLRDFPDTGLVTEDYEEAARARNRCRSAGIAASPVDMLICAVARRYDWEILTADMDFLHYKRILGIRLLSEI